MSSVLPAAYDFDVWYPLLRGALALRGTIRIDQCPRGGVRPELWQDLAPGESRLLLDGAGAPSVERGLENFGRGTRLRALRRRLSDQVRFEHFWVLPNTGGGFVLLPAQDRERYRAGIDLLPGGRRGGRLVKRLLRTGARVGWSAPPGAAEVALITRRPGPPRGPVAPELGGGLAGVACGVPGYHQKVILQLMGTRWLPPRIVKVSRSPASRRQVETEARNIERLARRFGSRTPAPLILGRGEQDDTAYLVQEVLHGGPAGDTLGVDHASFLTTLQDATLTELPLAAVPCWRNDSERLAHARAGNDRSWCVTVDALGEAIRCHWGERGIPTSLCHGDFTPWNLRRTAEGLRAFDWEYSEEEAPALRDLFHFLVQTGILLRRWRAARILVEVERMVETVARRLVAAAALDARDVLGCLGLYLHHVTIFDEYLHGIVRSPFAPLDWLRKTRLELIRQVTSRLAEGQAPRGRDERVA